MIMHKQNWTKWEYLLHPRLVWDASMQGYKSQVPFQYHSLPNVLYKVPIDRAELKLQAWLSIQPRQEQQQF